MIELENGRKFGKATSYLNFNDSVHNQIWGSNGMESKKEVEPEDAFFTKEGGILKALAYNWRDLV